jgi:hypothetical protein
MLSEQDKKIFEQAERDMTTRLNSFERKIEWTKKVLVSKLWEISKEDFNKKSTE